MTINTRKNASLIRCNTQEKSRVNHPDIDDKTLTTAVLSELHPFVVQQEVTLTCLLRIDFIIFGFKFIFLQQFKEL